MQPVQVIGVGPGCELLLTRDAEQEIAQADLVWCASRHAALVPEAHKVRPLLPLKDAIGAICEAREEGRRAVVLVSGDTGLYSLLGRLTEALGRAAVAVHPGISALQLFSAKLGISWQESCILSAHGRALSRAALCHHVRTHRQTFLFLDSEHDPQWVWQTLEDGGLSAVRLMIGERLSYADGTVEPYAPRAYAPLCMAYVENDSPEDGLPPLGLPDDAFIRGKTPMTKREIRILAVNALGLHPSSVVWDIGAGTGSVTVECARQCPLGHVYAIEYKPEALELIQTNVQAFHLLNVDVVSEKAPQCLAQLPLPDRVFLGGTEGCAAEVIALLEAAGREVQLAATAVTMESASQLTALLQNRPGFTCAQIGVTRLEQVGSYQMLRAQNPVFLFAARIGGKA